MKQMNNIFFMKICNKTYFTFGTFALFYEKKSILIDDIFFIFKRIIFFKKNIDFVIIKKILFDL